MNPKDITKLFDPDAELRIQPGYATRSGGAVLLLHRPAWWQFGKRAIHRRLIVVLRDSLPPHINLFPKYRT